MIPLSPRLLCCASFVTGDYVLDIGTDHAYLPVYLVMSGKCRAALGTDVRQGPIESAKNTVKHYRVANAVTLMLTDGFDNVPSAGITDVVIAGMGGETIRDILAADSGIGNLVWSDE
jgi:tRNA A22 N-methylase